MDTRSIQVASPFPRNEHQISFGDIFCIIAPACLFLEVVLLGRIFVTEFAFAATLPVLLSKRAHLLRVPVFRTFTALCFVWLLSQIVSDIIGRSAFEDWSRGWAKITIFYANCLAIYLLTFKKPHRIIYIAFGIAIGLTLRYFFAPTPYTVEYPWKFGVGPSITTVLLIAASWRLFGASVFLRLVIIFFAAALNFYFEFRSLGAICLFSGVVYAVAEYARVWRPIGTSIRTATLSLVVISTATIAFLTYGSYMYALEHGWFSEENEIKFTQQAEGELGTIFGGRSEIFISLVAVSESPIIGYGSWAKSPELAELYLLQLRSKGYTLQGELESDLIQTHSHIFGAWVEAGLMGGILWLWVLWLTIRTLAQMVCRPNSIQPIYFFVILSHLWAIIFSPLNGELRIITALGIGTLIFLVDFYSRQPSPAFSSFLGSQPAR